MHINNNLDRQQSNFTSEGLSFILDEAPLCDWLDYMFQQVAGGSLHPSLIQCKEIHVKELSCLETVSEERLQTKPESFKQHPSPLMQWTESCCSRCIIPLRCNMRGLRCRFLPTAIRLEHISRPNGLWLRQSGGCRSRELPLSLKKLPWVALSSPCTCSPTCFWLSTLCISSIQHIS